MGAGAAASFGEHEVAEPAVAGMRQRRVAGPGRGSTVSSMASGSGSRGTMRSVPSLPTGTLSQVPCAPKSTRQSSSRSNSSPMRIPVARSTMIAVRAKASSRLRDGGHQVAVDVGWQGSGSGSGRRGRSARNSSRRAGWLAQPHAAMSSKKTRRSTTSWWNWVADTVASGAVGAPAGSGAGPGEERFDVPAAVELIEAGRRRDGARRASRTAPGST